MKKKNGFTLIELVVVIALIAILAVTLAPRLRDQIAKGRDSKAIALLGSLRTASEIYFAENGNTVSADNSLAIDAALDAAAIADLEDGLDNSAKALLRDGNTTNGLYAPIGGGRASAADGPVLYGGEITFTFDSPDDAVASSDGIAIWFTGARQDATAETVVTYQFDTKGSSWSSY